MQQRSQYKDAFPGRETPRQYRLSGCLLRPAHWRCLLQYGRQAETVEKEAKASILLPLLLVLRRV